MTQPLAPNSPATSPTDTTKRRALGRGLDALLPSAAPSPAYGEKSVFMCALEKIRPQKGQPRQHFDAEALEDLASSIREHGLLEPIVVRRASGGADVFEIIAGERRWRACQKAGLHDAMVVVKDVSPQSAFELALIENVQREDLNPVELAEALERLIKEHGYTQETLGLRLGKDRTTITNSLRLLRLPEQVRMKVMIGELSEGHARALLGAEGDTIESLAERVIRGKMSVRATEALVRMSKKSGSGGKPPTIHAPEKSASVRDLERRLSQTMGMQVEVRDDGNRGEVVIPYADLDALDRIIARLE